MIVTEEEAKTKRCQEGFAAATGISADGIPVMQPETSGPISSVGAVGYYGVSRGGAPMNCIGSACMAWRWRRDGTYSPVMPTKISADDSDDSYLFTEPKIGYSATHGYCGKAGSP